MPEAYNPKLRKEDIQDASFTVKGSKYPKGPFTAYDETKTGDIAGVKDAGASLDEQLREAETRTKIEKARGELARTQKANKQPGFLKRTVQTQAGFRKAYYDKRKLGLVRRENLATHRANIEQRKLAIKQQRVTQRESKLRELELKKARRDFLKAQAEERRVHRAAPLSDRAIRGKPLVGKPVRSGVTQRGFFAGPRKATSGRSNPVSGSQGFFAGIKGLKGKGRKKGGFFS